MRFPGSFWAFLLIIRISEMRDLQIPDLTFPMLNYGRLETPLTLLPMLYLGGAGTKANLVSRYIDQGTLGVAVLERVPLIQKVHEYIEGKLVAGGSRGSARTAIVRFREFVAWADKNGRSVTQQTIEETYIAWSHYLLQRSRLGTVSKAHIYQSAVAVAKLIDNALELRRGVLARTPLRRSSFIKPFVSIKADKQNLEQTFEFGQALFDIANALSSEVIVGPIPVVIKFRTGQVIEEWLKLKSTELVKTLSDKVRPSAKKIALAKRAGWLADNSMRTRYPLVNLRIEAEMLIFIAQTGMNLEQVITLKMSKFRYRRYIDGYQVHRVYKGRRQGEVAFDIFSQYRKVFERYLAWRAVMFPDDEEELLFPLIRKGRAVGSRPPAFGMVRKVCKKLAIRFCAPRMLRKTRINWLLRRSNDPTLTAEMHAHTQETLIRYYEQPSLQIALVEISRFHARAEQAIAAPGPGVCEGLSSTPQPVANIPSDATPPDCIGPAGCLFCEHQRDLDTEDHVWSLASYRYLKSLELSRFRAPAKNRTIHPAAAAIDRLTKKLNYFERSSQVRKRWVQEALMRVDEDYHHPRWDGFVRLMEARK